MSLKPSEEVLKVWKLAVFFFFTYTYKLTLILRKSKWGSTFTSLFGSTFLTMWANGCGSKKYNRTKYVPKIKMKWIVDEKYLALYLWCGFMSKIILYSFIFTSRFHMNLHQLIDTWQLFFSKFTLICTNGVFTLS